eukprot:NODE_574_length_5874_cov_0.812294.p4 type:complete len:265 gc:universal NODE_574_length_5874_cov_0.812294:1826-2620(+)
MSEQEIFEWHQDGWFKGNICALAILTFFLTVPGYFDKMGGGRFSAATGLFALLALIIRPVRSIYGGACEGISIAYWLCISIFTGIYIAYMGARFMKKEKIYIGLGVLVSITQATTIAGHHSTCSADGDLLAESFESWTSYAFVITFGVSILMIIHAIQFFKVGEMAGDDKRLKKLDVVNRVALILSPISLLVSSLISFANAGAPFKQAASSEILMAFIAIYLASVSHITMFLYDSLNKYMKAATENALATMTNNGQVSTAAKTV